MHFDLDMISYSKSRQRSISRHDARQVSLPYGHVLALFDTLRETNVCSSNDRRSHSFTHTGVLAELLASIKRQRKRFNGVCSSFVVDGSAT
jgi:hypothetical protein